MSDFIRVCDLDQLVRDRGVAVLLGEQQIALFRVVVDGSDTVFAVGHHDPFSEANVIARGLVGSVGDRDVVASPMYKQAFDLRTGVCLTDPEHRLPVWAARLDDGGVYVDPDPVPAALLDSEAPQARVAV